MSTKAPSQRSAGILTVILGVGCVLLAVMVVLLARQNLSLKQRLAANTTTTMVDALRPGDRLGSLVLVDGTGRTDPVEFAQGIERTLLLVFSATCPACQETLPQWERLLSGNSPGQARVLGVQVDADAEPVFVPFPSYRVDHDASNALDRIPYVPATVLLDSDGIVEEIWFGVLGEEEQRELGRWLNRGQPTGG